MKKHLLFLIILGIFFQIFTSKTLALDCSVTRCVSGCSCGGHCHGDKFCSGSDCKVCSTGTIWNSSGCGCAAPTAVPTTAPTAVPTTAPTAVPTTSSGGGSTSCSSTCSIFGSTWHPSSVSCPSGQVNDCGAYSGCSCCVCVAAPTPIPVCTTCPSLPTCACPTVYGSDSPQCSISKNSIPTISDITIKSGISPFNTVIAETGNRNQICQATFNGSRTVTFVINANDPDGDTLTYALSWNGHSIPMIGNIGTITFPDNYNDNNPHSLVFTITDGYGGSATDSSRGLKVWDCKVKVSGSIYDGTDGISCPSNPPVGFSTLAKKDVLNFKSLVFRQGGIPYDMTVNTDGVSYTSGSNGLIWGLNGYIPQFNSDIALSNQKMKSGLNCNFWIDTTGIDGIDPYPSNTSYVADFSGIISQDPWWQANNGGVIGNSSIDDRVPVTCPDTDATCKISRNGLVSAVSIYNTGKKLDKCQNWYYSGPSIKMANVNNNYAFFYDRYFSENGVGITLASGDKNIANIGTTGIYFVNGNLTIDNNKTINPGNFLMIIVNGDIKISGTVTRIDGILVANNIGATGVGDNQLVFNGSLFAFNNVDFSRGYTKKSDNNLSPAVVVNYDPQLLFKLPSGVAKSLTSWQWGN